MLYLNMKKIAFLFVFVQSLVFAQGEQRYADGTSTDQDGNTFEWINYGTQDWAIKNAEVVTYRDGTPIPQVTDQAEWANLTTGAWCYYDNDTSQGKHYNWYAVMGIHDAASLSNPSNRKEFSPEGWHVPSRAEWFTLQEILIANGYNYDGTTTGNKIAKAMASTTGWSSSTNTGAVGNDQSLNNSSGFNALPVSGRGFNGLFGGEGDYAFFWTSTESTSSNNNAYFFELDGNAHLLYNGRPSKRIGSSVRFVRDAQTASTNEYSRPIIVYPNPTTSTVTLQSDKQYEIGVYTLQGKKVMALTGNTIDMSHLSSATYIVKALDKVENEEASYKVVKN